jgi:hypothetical protein
MSGVWLLKSVEGLCPRSAHRMGHRPPLDFCRCYMRILKVMLWRLILNLAVNLQPPMMFVFVSGDWHSVHMRDGLCFLLHLRICNPNATSSESLLAR